MTTTPYLTRLVRHPLAWLIAAELVVVAALGLVTWHLLTAPRHGTPVATLPGMTSTSPPLHNPAWGRRVASEPSPRAGSRPGGSNPHAGTVDPGAVDALARRLGAEYPAWEHTEWDLVTRITDYARTYVHDHVLPAVESAAARRG